MNDTRKTPAEAVAWVTEQVKALEMELFVALAAVKLIPVAPDRLEDLAMAAATAAGVREQLSVMVGMWEFMTHDKWLPTL